MSKMERLFPEKHKTDLKSRVEALERQMTRIERGLYLLEQASRKPYYVELAMAPPDPPIEEEDVEPAN